MISDVSSRASSPLSSLQSRTPSPASLFPSPPLSQNSSNDASPAPDSRSGSQDDNQRPKKRRRISTPRPRVTQYLDVRSEDICSEQSEQLMKLRKVLEKKRKIVVIAGAGISVSAGSML